MMRFYYVYIVKCKDDSYYTGITNSIDRRLYEHNSGIKPDSYTYSRRPVVLVWFESFTDPTQAIMIEKKIKGWSRRKKEALIIEDWDKLVQYSKNYTEFGKAPFDKLRMTRLRQVQDDKWQAMSR
jgi:putative endonuclease